MISSPHIFRFAYMMKNRENSSVKHSKENHILLSFLNLSTLQSAVQNCLSKLIFICNSSQTEFRFTTSETKIDYYHQKVNARVASLVAERVKT